MSPLLLIGIIVVSVLHLVTFVFVWKDNRLELKHKLIATGACLLLPILANIVALVIFEMATDKKTQ